jgi:hypothetical protein
MCSQGWLELRASESVYCGRCGAPAIADETVMRSLLIELQRECIKACGFENIIKREARRTKLDVKETVEEKGQSIKEKRVQIRKFKSQRKPDRAKE